MFSTEGALRAKASLQFATEAGKSAKGAVNSQMTLVKPQHLPQSKVVSTIWNYAGSHKKVCMQSRRKAWRDCGIDALGT